MSHAERTSDKRGDQQFAPERNKTVIYCYGEQLWIAGNLDVADEVLYLDANCHLPHFQEPTGFDDFKTIVRDSHIAPRIVHLSNCEIVAERETLTDTPHNDTTAVAQVVTLTLRTFEFSWHMLPAIVEILLLQSLRRLGVAFKRVIAYVAVNVQGLHPHRDRIIGCLATGPNLVFRVLHICAGWIASSRADPCNDIERARDVCGHALQLFATTGDDVVYVVRVRSR